MLVNNLLNASRVPWILEQKGIEFEENVLRINIERDVIQVSIYRTEDIKKFDGWKFEPYDYESISTDHIGNLSAEFEGIRFSTCVRKDEIELIKS